MINKRMYDLGNKRSAIRELFEYGKSRAEKLGSDSVCDFSLGNPSVPAPACVSETLERIIRETESTALHSYTSAQGNLDTRKAVVNDLNKRFGSHLSADKVYMTCGASAGLTITMKALNEGNDEFIILAPFFPEYQIFIETMGGVPVIVPCTNDFDINFDALQNALSPRTKAVIVNSPNNPSGVVYSKQSLERLALILEEHNAKCGHTVYVIADEPYRELVFDDANVTFVPCVYKHTIVCYSYSKSLSLPGERIGYIAVNPDADGADMIYTAVLGAGRALGYVCAPALFQRLIAECAEVRPNLTSYAKNRETLYKGLIDAGYTCIKPNGAFYLFLKAPDGDAVKFSQKAKELGLLVVPGNDFHAYGWVRIAYCVSESTIIRALPLFKTLAESYK